MNFRTDIRNILGFFVVLLPILFYSCSASSTVRYDRDKEEAEKEAKSGSYEENFDILPYKTKIEVQEEPAGILNNEQRINAWYGYGEKDTTSNQEKAIVGTTNGFRVQVLATDNLEEADSLKSDLSSKVTQKRIYVIFDPPFYKVEVGDFINMSDAKDLNFRLNQMGYTESRVIASTVNIFE
jgi:hypothetical protein